MWMIKWANDAHVRFDLFLLGVGECVSVSVSVSVSSCRGGQRRGRRRRLQGNPFSGRPSEEASMGREKEGTQLDPERKNMQQ